MLGAKSNSIESGLATSYFERIYAIFLTPFSKILRKGVLGPPRIKVGISPTSQAIFDRVFHLGPGPSGSSSSESILADGAVRKELDTPSKSTVQLETSDPSNLSSIEAQRSNARERHNGILN